MAGDIAMLVAGFVLLVKGADWLVKSASALARSLGVSDLVVGLTVVAFGTSAPELVVSVLSSIKGSPDLSIGNVVGSNICNILLILGVSALIRPLFATRGTVWKEIPFMLLATAALIVQANDAYLDDSASTISRGDGLLLLLFFAVFLVYIGQAVGDLRRRPGQERPAFRAKSGLLLGLSLAMLIGGAAWTVNGAKALALGLGLSESLLGLTVLAVGTSLPELATSAVAAYRGNNEIAVGNIVGSNIFNVFFILGVSAVASPLPCGAFLNGDLAVMAAASLLLFLAMFFGRPKHQVQRYEAGFFLLLYAGYIAWLAHRG
ncbi:MAG: calcium/sodium antiporter [Candidatus Hydrogenedentes bacterium]|nr:calcium/sodium antiporter [Candidatus Hydrogenedentota bacterium]